MCTLYFSECRSCCWGLSTLTQAAWPPLCGDFLLLDLVSGHLGVQGTKTQHFIQRKCIAGSSLIKLQKLLDQLTALRAAETNLWGLGASKTVSPNSPMFWPLSTHCVSSYHTGEIVLALCLSLLTPLFQVRRF